MPQSGNAQRFRRRSIVAQLVGNGSRGTRVLLLPLLRIQTLAAKRRWPINIARGCTGGGGGCQKGHRAYSGMSSEQSFQKLRHRYRSHSRHMQVACGKAQWHKSGHPYTQIRRNTCCWRLELRLPKGGLPAGWTARFRVRLPTALSSLSIDDCCWLLCSRSGNVHFD